MSIEFYTFSQTSGSQPRPIGAQKDARWLPLRMMSCGLVGFVVLERGDVDGSVESLTPKMYSARVD